MSWGIQYWIIIKIIKRFFTIYFGRIGSKPGVLDLRTYTHIYIYILDLKQSSINVISWVIHGFSGLFVCLFNMCNSKRTKMISSTWDGDFTRPTSRILLHWTIICMIWIYYWTRRLSAMTLNCTFADYSCSVLYL